MPSSPQELDDSLSVATMTLSLGDDRMESRKKASRLPADVWFDAFAILPRPYLDTLQITSRIHRHVVVSLMPKMCLRRINVARVQAVRQEEGIERCRIRVVQHLPGPSKTGRKKIVSYPTTYRYITALLSNSLIKLLRFSDIRFEGKVWPARFRERVMQRSDFYVRELLFDKAYFWKLSVDEFNAFVLGFRGTQQLKFRYSKTTTEQTSNSFLEKTVQNGISVVCVQNAVHNPHSPPCGFDENGVLEACRSFCGRLPTTSGIKQLHFFLHVPNLMLPTSQLIHRLIEQAHNGGLEKLTVTIFPIAHDAMNDLMPFMRPEPVGGRRYHLFDIPDERARITLRWRVTKHRARQTLCRYITLYFKRTSSSKPAQ